ncbi:MAG: hypothetical protein KBA30_06675 [Clostridia bacterium]|nr:hypothetical protein [Clostridia bacterium]
MDISVHGCAPQITVGCEKVRNLGAGMRLHICNLDVPEGRGYWDAGGMGALPGEQGYRLVSGPDGTFTLGGDPDGCLYGLLDLAHALEAGAPLPAGVDAPAVRYRGIKFNIPLDARTPSYSDASDSAWANIPHMWDMAFWERLLDFLASEKYNVVSLWSLHPFPSMVRVPGYEAVALEDVKRTREPVFGASTMGFGTYSRRYSRELETVRRMTMDEKIAFWRAVMRYGADRGIAFYIITWNVFVYGTEGNPYGIDDRMDNPVTRDYFRRSVAALIETYPLLAGIGVTAGERMSIGRDAEGDVARDVRWLAETYGVGITDAVGDGGRPFRLIHRQHFSGAREILQAFEGLPATLDLSFKYSQAHMYSSTRPAFGNAFFASLPEGCKTWLTVRNDDLYMMRWGGTGFAREYLANMPLELVRGILIGPDGYTIGRDCLERGGPAPADAGTENPPRLVLERQWYREAVWGRLMYDPALPDAHFEDLLRLRLGCSREDAAKMFRLCETVSRVIPLVNTVHWHDFDFQNYPEANVSLERSNTALHVGRRLLFHDIHDYLLTPAQPGTGALGVEAAVGLELRGLPPPDGAILPDAVARELAERADGALRMLDGWPADGTGDEMCALAEDARCMALLGRFFSLKLACALETLRTYYALPGSDASRAIALGREAADAYETYARKISARYRPQRLARMHGWQVDVMALCEDARADAEAVRMIMEPFER